MLNKENIIVASKYFNVEEMRSIYNLGYKNFGENKAQDFKNKKASLSELDINWHFIGNLQRKNIKYVVPCDLIHSINSLELLKEVNEYCIKKDLTQEVLLQLKLNNEENQTALNIDELIYIKENEAIFDRIKISGLMVLGPNTDDEDAIAQVFARANTLKKQYGFQTLSMGMSNDYQIAIKNGATYVRLGSYFKKLIEVK